MDVRSMLRQSVWVSAYVSANSFGEPGYAAPRQVAARVEVVRGVVGEGATGSEARVSATLVVAERIGPQDRVWLPGDTPADEKKARVPGPDGVTEGVDLLTGQVDFFEVRLT